MATFTITLPEGVTLTQGKQITFTAPADSTGITGIIIDNITYTLLKANGDSLETGAFINGALISVLIDLINHKAYIQNAASVITQDANNRFVTDAEKSTWNAKLDASQKGAANGIASLDDDGKVPAEQLPQVGGKRTARFTVGTSTAGWTTADCDYLCDGTADDAEISAALNALPAGGGEVVILDGTYNITASINIPKNNVSIRGNGNATILKRMWNSSVAEGVVTLTGRTDCRIEGIEFNGNRTSYTNSNNNYGIYLATSNSNTITGNTCNNSSSTGIYLATSSNNTITSNTFNNNNPGSGTGIRISTSSSNNTVTGNTCKDNYYGIGINTTSSNNTITGNTCNDNSFGIHLNTSDNNTITGNTCNNNNYGVYLATSDNNTVTGNTCNDSLFGGICLNKSRNSTITGNTCNDNGTGICLDKSSNNNTTTGNTCIRGTGQASDYTTTDHTILVKGTSNIYNLIANNNCMGKAVTSEGGTGNTLINNKFDLT